MSKIAELSVAKVRFLELTHVNGEAKGTLALVVEVHLRHVLDDGRSDLYKGAKGQDSQPIPAWIETFMYSGYSEEGKYCLIFFSIRAQVQKKPPKMEDFIRLFSNLPSTKLKPTMTESTITAIPVSAKITLQNGDIFWLFDSYVEHWYRLMD